MFQVHMDYTMFVLLEKRFLLGILQEKRIQKNTYIQRDKELEYSILRQYSILLSRRQPLQENMYLGHRVCKLFDRREKMFLLHR